MTGHLWTSCHSFVVTIPSSFLQIPQWQRKRYTTGTTTSSYPIFDNDPLTTITTTISFQSKLIVKAISDDNDFIDITIGTSSIPSENVYETTQMINNTIGNIFDIDLLENDSVNSQHTVTTTNTTTENPIWWSIVLLNIVAILWGTQHAVIKGVVDAAADRTILPPMVFNDIWTTTTSTIATPITDIVSTTRIDDISASSSSSSMILPAVFTLLRFTIAAMIVSPYTPAFPSSDLFQTLVSSSAWNNTTTITTAAGTVQNKNENITDGISIPEAIPNKSLSNSNRIWRWGIEMGIYMFLGFSLQAIGLQYTTAQRSGFLLYLNVKFVPFLAYLIYQRPIRTVTLLSALTAFTGTALLAYNPNDSTVVADTVNTIHWTNLISFNVGDIWTMAAAMASAMFILRLEQASNELGQYENNATANFNAASLWVVAFLSFLWTLVATISETTFTSVAAPASSSLLLSYNLSELTHTFQSTQSEMESLLRDHLWELIYLGGVTTAFANYVQTRAQRYISAERASIIYAMDPVYGAFFSYVLLGETLNGITGYIGAAFIVVAAATNALLESSTK